MRAPSFLALAVSLSLVESLVISCASSPNATSFHTSSTAAVPKVAPPKDVVESVEPWTFHGAEGTIIRTPHYRIYTTEHNPIFIDRLPGFLEASLTHYRIAITPLPPPRLRLDTFLMDTRPQWVLVARQLLGADGDQLTQIQRGGFATRGIGVFYDIGVFDTLAVAAHEGWHQYTQRAFNDRLPVWLEEGLATYMEGHKWDGAEPIFLPWANIERFDQLRKAAAAGDLLSLADLLATSPHDIPPTAGDSLVTYYAQIWALVHFLDAGANRRYQPALRAIVSDAARGQLRRTLLVKLGSKVGAKTITTGRGPGALQAYIVDLNLDELSFQYDQFIVELVAPGSRDRIVAGRSPISSPAR